MMILESLRRQPAHGYALVQHIQERSKNLLQVEEGSLYPALQRLLKAKLVKAEWGVSATNRRVRTYEITASGLRHLEQQISSFERMFEGISLVLRPGKSATTRESQSESARVGGSFELCEEANFRPCKEVEL